MIGYYNLANIITFCSVAFGFIAVNFAFKENLSLTTVFLLLSGIADILDGKVSRKLSLTKKEAEFGVQLDSLADIVAFGVCPAMVFYFIGFNGILDITLLIFFIICGIIRLAHFNISGVEDEGGAKYYTGLPITFVAFIISITFTIFKFIPEFEEIWVLRAEVFMMAMAFILKFKVAKPRGIALISFIILAISLIILNLI